MSAIHWFSEETLSFLKKAGRQKNLEWLVKNKEGFESFVRLPLQDLAGKMAVALRPIAPGYHFPLKGLGRIKRSSARASEYGSVFKSHVSFTITRPATSRFDHNPSLYFMIDSEDREGDEVLLAGGLYIPSSRQLKSIREAISKNALPFEKLFSDPEFKKSFPNGFSDERTATRPPRGFDPSHPYLGWLKLQAAFVWKSYRKKEYTSARFAEKVSKDGAQILRLNALLDQAMSGRWPEAVGTEHASDHSSGKRFHERLAGSKVVLHTPDF